MMSATCNESRFIVQKALPADTTMDDAYIRVVPKLIDLHAKMCECLTSLELNDEDVSGSHLPKTTSRSSSKSLDIRPPNDPIVADQNPSSFSMSESVVTCKTPQFLNRGTPVLDLEVPHDVMSRMKFEFVGPNIYIYTS